MKTIIVTADMVKETEAYKKLNPIQKKLSINKRNILNSIQYGFNVILNTSIDRWNQITNTNEHNKSIIIELIDKYDKKQS